MIGSYFSIIGGKEDALTRHLIRPHCGVKGDVGETL